MNRYLYRYLQSMIAIGMATFLAEKFISGRLSFYINLRFAMLTLLAMIVLAGMAWIGLQSLMSANPTSGKPGRTFILLFFFPLATALLGLSAPVIITMYLLVLAVGLVRIKTISVTQHNGNAHNPQASPSALIILLIPLLLGALVPVRPLTTAAINSRGMSLAAPTSLESQPLTALQAAPDDRTVLDWVKLFNHENDLSPYVGEQANVVGFIYHDERLNAGQFMLGRFVITCCAADAFAIGMAVAWDESGQLPDNAWVNVKGSVDFLEVDDKRIPLIHAESVTPIPAPDQPYLYP